MKPKIEKMFVIIEVNFLIKTMKCMKKNNISQKKFHDDKSHCAIHKAARALLYFTL